MNKKILKDRAKQYEQRFEELFTRKQLTSCKATKKQLQNRMNLMRELQRSALAEYHNLVTQERRKK